jgi:hypothetical protein
MSSAPKVGRGRGPFCDLVNIPLAAAAPIVDRMLHATPAALATSGRSYPGPAAQHERLRAFPTAWVEPDRRGHSRVFGSLCFRNGRPLVIGKAFPAPFVVQISKVLHQRYDPRDVDNLPF